MRPIRNLILAGLLALACGLAVRPGDQPDGAALYKQKCSMCHGPEGKGFPALKTPDFTDPKWQESVTDKQMVEVINQGKKGTPMPPFAEKLKPEEIDAVVAFIRTLNSKKKQ